MNKNIKFGHYLKKIPGKSVDELFRAQDFSGFRYAEFSLKATQTLSEKKKKWRKEDISASVHLKISIFKTFKFPMFQF